MAEIKWIKIATDIFEDEKIILIESLPEGDTILAIWFKLLAFAGKQNNSGVFTFKGSESKPYTPRMLATIFRRDIEAVEMAINILEEYGLISIDNGVISIPNWGKHQNIDQMEKRNDYMKNYMADYRQKQKEISSKVNSKPNVKVNVNVNGKANSKLNVSALEEELDKELDKDKDINNICSADGQSECIKEYQNELFIKFWNAYPRKIGKQKCANWWKSNKPSKALVDKMLSTIEKFQNAVWSSQEIQYVPHPYTWLNRGGWDDELPYDDAYYSDPNAGFTVL